jgi:hypothetical protein
MDRRANADGFCSPFCFCVFFRSLECVGDVGGRLAVVSFLSFLFSLLSQVSFFAVFPTDLYVLDVFSIKYNPVNYIFPPPFPRCRGWRRSAMWAIRETRKFRAPNRHGVIVAWES